MAGRRAKGEEMRRKILVFVGDHIAANEGASPTLEQIGVAVGLNSIASVHKHLAVLEQLGRIQRDPLTRAIHFRNVCPGCGRRMRRKPKAAA
jgi:SOS-response transcriptional repressor LexA